MAWIEVHQSLKDHRKTLAMADELGCSEAQIVGHMVCLWLWSVDNADRNGYVTLRRNVIERAALWTGQDGAFIDALMTVGFIDQDPETGALRIHNWEKYIGRLTIQREANAERQRRLRERRRENKDPETGSNGDVTVTSRTRNGTPNRTSNTSNEVLDKPPFIPPKEKRATQLPDDFEVTDEMREQAISYGVPAERIDAETEKWRDHHRAKGSTMKDWLAAWRYWMRNVPTFTRPAPNGRQPPLTYKEAMAMPEAERLAYARTLPANSGLRAAITGEVYIG
jgi:hypothetical protein